MTSTTTRPTLDGDNPWPGLTPFEESERGFFRGREAETAELLRLVQRESLTVLFGRSGLGKTSLLRAGLFPALREVELLPVYLRLDHGAGAPPLRQQVLDELRLACEAEQVEAPRLDAGQPLWSCFHRRDAEFWSRLNRPVTPVIVFDQFEEIFTLGQDGLDAQARSAAFLDELADLVENRAPAVVKQQLAQDPAAASQYEFRRATVKLVLSFREDFLAQIEVLKRSMPSVMINRLRLTPMDGRQAYAVVAGGGGALVDDEVSRRILRLAWKNEPAPPVPEEELPRIEVDPALLSVVCSELNQKRQQAQPPLATITPALLEGADRAIIAGFYERAMAGLDARVRSFVEDELITVSGFRDSRAWEDALSADGVTAEALGALVGRRLLRLDERQGQRRIELTHDVLTRVVRDSRNQRRAREAEAAAQAREQAAVQQQRRNRRIAAAVLATLVLMVLLSVVAGWEAMAAREARAEADRLLAQARTATLLNVADERQASQVDLALLLNVEAWREAPGLATESGLLRRFANRPYRFTLLAPRGEGGVDVAFDPSGRLLASGRQDGAVLLWDVAQRQARRLPESHPGRVSSVAFSPDGSRLASAGGTMLMLWDVAARRLLQRVDLGATVHNVAFSADGRQVATGDEMGRVRVWNVADGGLLKSFDTAHQGSVWSVAFAPGGGTLASVGDDAKVLLWDLATGRPRELTPAHGRPVFDVAFSPDGKRLATGGADERLVLWDLETFTRIATLPNHEDAVTRVAFSGDSRQLASASKDQQVILWDLSDQEPRVANRLLGQNDWVFGLAFSTDGRQLASAGDDGRVILWELDSSYPLQVLRDPRAAVLDLAFSPDGRQLVTADRDGPALQWNLADPRAPVPLPDRGERVAKLGFGAGSAGLVAVGPDGRWSHGPLGGAVAPGPVDGLQGEVYALAVSADGRRMAVAGQSGVVAVRPIDGATPPQLLDAHAGEVYALAFSPDGRQLATAHQDKVVRLWPLDGAGPPVELRQHAEPAAALAFSPDGRRLASGGMDKNVVLWDVATARATAVLQAHPDSVNGVAFSPDARLLATASTDKTVLLWDLASGRPVATLRHHQRQVLDVVFSPDGRRLASASEDGSAIVIDLDAHALADEACRTANRNLSCAEWRQHLGAQTPYRRTCPALPAPEPACQP